MPANLENFSKKRSWSVVVGAMRAHIGMNPRQSAGGPSCVAIFANVSKMDERLLATGIAGRPYELWRPPAGYAWLFPSGASATSASTDVAFLRAELNAPGGSLAESPAPAAAA